MTQSSLGTILLICTSHADLGRTGSKTGFWMEELTAPYYAFKDAGYRVKVASPKGGNPPVDPGSQSKDMQGPSVARFETDEEAVAALSSSTPLSEITNMDAFVGLFLAGGHGAMWDFPQNAELAQILVQATSQNKVIGAVCHGVAGLLSTDVSAALGGKAVAGFSNEEEAAVGLTDIVPFLLETKLGDVGFNYSSAGLFTPHVVIDGRLVTGQNPVSSQGTADAMIAALKNA
jgi:putative intracellular protease/amidase